MRGNTPDGAEGAGRGVGVATGGDVGDGVCDGLVSRGRQTGPGRELVVVCEAAHPPSRVESPRNKNARRA